MIKKSGIIVALDVPSLDFAGRLIEQLAPHVAAFKVGLEICTAIGVPKVVEFIHERGGQVFLDLKFGDIPNTVGKAVKEAAYMGVAMMNVHASCGSSMMHAAVENRGRSKVLGVTVLTSISDRESEDLFREKASIMAYRFGALAFESDLDGVVCAVREVSFMKGLGGSKSNSFLAITPGIRPEWASVDDQKRLATPAEAVRAGSDYLVIGRPITNPPTKVGSPARAAELINEEMNNARKDMHS
jgi:orotidine-5'-phosphate decarboxylase